MVPMVVPMVPMAAQVGIAGLENTDGSVYFVLGPSEHGTPTFPLPPLFSKVLSIQ